MKSKRKEQLPDGRWQHFCVRCDKPLEEERLFQHSFDYQIKCPDCIPKFAQFQTLPVSRWE